MSRTYVISDLHGRNDLLVRALSEIEEKAPHAGTHTIITTGDYVDRGYESCEVIQTLMNFKSDRFEMINLMGNHETFLIDAAKYGSGADFWCQYNGGTATLFSYGAKAGEYIDTGLIHTDHVEWAEKLRLYYQDEHRVYVHAGIPYTEADIRAQPKHELLWMRYNDEDKDYHYQGKTIVHGHEQYKDGPKEWTGRVDLDTMAWYTGRLVVGVFDDDLPGSYTSTITIQGKTFKELQAERAGY